MTPQTLLRLYPRTWRERYGDEFVALLEKEGTGPRVVFNVMAGAFDAWMSPRTPGQMALDGPFGPAVLLERTDIEEGRYTRSYWVHLLAAIGVGVLLFAMSPRPPVGYIAGFLAVWQLWVFRRFSLRTRVAAVFWVFVFITGGSFTLHTLLHRVIYPWFGK